MFDFKTDIPVGQKIVQLIQKSAPAVERAEKGYLRHHGTGTMVFDSAMGLLRKVPGVNKFVSESRVADAVHGVQSKLENVDRAAGSAIAKRFPRLANTFKTTVNKPAFTAVTDLGQTVHLNAPFEEHRLTAPIDKTKRFTMPMLAVGGISSMLDNKERQNEGDSVVNRQADTNLSEKSIDKFAKMEKDDTVLVESDKVANSKDPPSPQVLQKAASMLTFASTKINDLEKQLNKYAEENRKLTLQVMAKERSNRAVKLAKEMKIKGLLKEAEVDEEVDRIMDMDDKTFEILSSTVRNVQQQTKVASNANGLSSLSGLYQEDFDSHEKTSSLAQEIISLTNLRG